MIPDNAFLRRLPTMLDGSQVVQLEALVFSADSVESSMDAIRCVTIEHRERICEAPRHVRVGLFTHAWTIVDCVHIVRQVLTALDYQTPVALAFQEKYECARRLRNKMDHLIGNALNTAGAKRRPPVFGALGYVCIPDQNFLPCNGQVTITGGGMVLLTAGRLAPGQHMTAVNPAGLDMSGPVGGFRLEAFDQSLKLEEAEQDLRSLMIEINDRLETYAQQRAEAISSEQGIPMEKLMANPPGGLSLFIAFTTGQAQPTSTIPVAT